MLTEPIIKRAHVFIDGQNLFHSVKEAFGYTYPNYNIRRLVSKTASSYNWKIQSIRFYTGIPDEKDDPTWHRFWIKKLSAMGRQGIKVFSRPLRYRNQTIQLPGGEAHTFLVGEEKGVDVRLALDIVRTVRTEPSDVIVVFSQDQDLSEVADEIRLIAAEKKRWIKIVSVFPVSAKFKNTRGINKTDWIHIDRGLYDSCIDAHDYRM